MDTDELSEDNIAEAKDVVDPRDIKQQKSLFINSVDHLIPQNTSLSNKLAKVNLNIIGDIEEEYNSILVNSHDNNISIESEHKQK